MSTTAAPGSKRRPRGRLRLVLDLVLAATILALLALVAIRADRVGTRQTSGIAAAAPQHRLGGGVLNDAGSRHTVSAEGRCQLLGSSPGRGR